MSFYPCSLHGSMFKGAAQAAYPALVEGNDSERVHLRMCPSCFKEYIGNAAEKLGEVADGSKAQPDAFRLCCMCGAEAGRTRLFITAYPAKEEPRQFFGAVCEADIEAARVEWMGTGPAS